MKYDKLSTDISKWLADYLTSNNLKSFVIGVSGGIDSAVTSTLCAKTGHKTIVVSLPIHQESDQLEIISSFKGKFFHTLPGSCFIFRFPTFFS